MSFFDKVLGFEKPALATVLHEMVIWHDKIMTDLTGGEDVTTRVGRNISCKANCSPVCRSCSIFLFVSITSRPFFSVVSL